MKKDNIPDYPNFYVSKRGRVWKRIRDGTWSQIQLAKLVGLKSQGRISRIINKYQRVRMEP